MIFLCGSQLIVPASLADGWVCYAWDMKRKTIYVLDPLNLTEISDDRRSLHEDITSVLHSALCRCLTQYFDDWVLSEAPWSRTYPMLGRKKFSE